MNKSTNRTSNKYDCTGEYTRLVTGIVLTFIISSALAYMYLLKSDSYSLLLLSDDMAYAVRSGFFTGIIGWWVIKKMERT